jgi:hypothetical protein
MFGTMDPVVDEVADHPRADPMQGVVDVEREDSEVVVQIKKEREAERFPRDDLHAEVAEAESRCRCMPLIVG